jgi:hypothetical protein
VATFGGIYICYLLAAPFLSALTWAERKSHGAWPNAALADRRIPDQLNAYRLGISARTTEHHRAAVMQKMQARTISRLVRMALNLGHFNGANCAK